MSSFAVFDYTYANEYVDFDLFVEYNGYDNETKLILEFIDLVLFHELEQATRKGEKIVDSNNSKLVKYLRAVGSVDVLDQKRIFTTFKYLKDIFDNYIWTILFENYEMSWTDDKTKSFKEIRKEYFTIRNNLTMNKNNKIFNLFYKYKEIIYYVHNEKI